MIPRRFDRGGSSNYDDVTPRRDEGNNYYRDVHDSDFYEYQRRRSPSPRRDDRRMFSDKDSSWDSHSKSRNSGDWQDDRSRNRQARTPPNQRAGLLGAGPSDMAAGGQAGVGNQVLAAALQAQQTQAWLAALQANQVRLNNRDNNSSASGYNRNNQSRQQSNRQWNTRKRNSFPDSGGNNKRNRRDDNKQGNRFGGRDNQRRNQGRSNRDNKSNEYNPAEPTPDDDNGKSAKDLILDELCEKIEELRKREKIERNISDQDVDKLVAFSFDGNVYKCDVCKVMCKSPQSLKTHLMAKKHNMTLISERGDGKDPCRDIMDIDLKPDDWLAKNEVARVLLEKQAAAIDFAKQEQRRKEFEQNPANYVQYNVNSRKVAVKKDSAVSITTCSEVTVHVNEFSSDQHMFGCEFINAVVGFNCQLCDTLISRDSSVISHLQSREHKEKYKKHVEENEDYEATQVASNAKLDSVLSQNENKKVLLHESFDSDYYVYLKNEDNDLTKSKSSIPNWSTMGSLPTSQTSQTGLPFIDDDDDNDNADEEKHQTNKDGADELQLHEDEVEDNVTTEDNVAVEDGEIEDMAEDDAKAQQDEPENGIEGELESSQEPTELTEKEDAKELISRLPPRRAARGGGTAKRGKGRATPKSTRNKARSATAAAVAASLNESTASEGYDVIDDVMA